MSEVFTGYPPYHDIPHDENLPQDQPTANELVNVLHVSPVRYKSPKIP
ncbi:3103_t:CDS:2 [Cetraspora pellucida]|uniref:3103_t:CDS:1 n=1 Tax=Cetraspora pellucida TaxID=1433469 RepID=A0A9N8VR37_9GLOM|nr:3103_t:CDS:2 [Cetraspora pellucida]